MTFAGSLRSFGFALLTVVALACSSDDTTGSQTPPPGSHLTVDVSPDRDSILLGTTKKFSATVMDQFKAVRSAPVLWSSTNAAVLTVGSDGVVTAVGEGSAQVVAAISGDADTAAVSVYGLAGSLRVYPEAVALPIGDEFQVQAATSTNAGTSQLIGWSSSDSSVATVSHDGLVTAVGEGSVQINATLGGSFARAGVDVFKPAIATVTISPAVSSVATGESLNLNVTARSATGKKIGGRLTVEWNVSDTTIATIDQSGRVTGKARGFVTVRATVDGKSATGTVNVTFAAVSSVTTTLPDSSLVEGENVMATAIVKDASGAPITGIALSWQSSNPSVATVDASGKVSALSSGTATINAISGGKVGSVPVSVSQGVVTSVGILPASPSVVVGGSAQLVAQVLGNNGAVLSAQQVTWASSNPLIATVNSAGLITGISAGAANITATSGSHSATVQVTVTAVPIASLTMSPPSATIDPGATVALSVTARDAAGNVLSGRVPSWSSSNTAIATVSSAGVVTAVQSGTVTVSASVEGKTATATVTVRTPAAGAVASLEVTANASSLKVGQSTQAVATVRDSAGTVLSGQLITWKSLDATIATVSPSGFITAVAGGSVAIIASSGGVSGSLAISVATPEAAAVATVQISLSPTSIAGGATSKATVTLKDAQGNVLTGRTVAYSSGNVTVATVAANGTVTGLSSGESGITATSEGKSAKAFIHVTSGSPTVARVAVSASPTTLGPGGGTQATATAYDAEGNALPKSFVWNSSNPSVVAVGSNGVLSAIAPGNATIVALETSTNVQGTLGVTVSSSTTISVASVSVSLGSSTLASGQTTQTSAVARDAGGSAITGLTFTYSSSNTAVATVNTAGLVTAIAAGNATISASAGGKVGSAPLTVTTQTPAPSPVPPTSAADALAKIGPTITPAAASALGGGYAKYDALWAKWEPTRFTADGTLWSASNYYDRAQIYYAQWIRTGNSAYKQRGDAIAVDYRRNYLHASNYQTSPHWAQLDGVALHYWLTGDDSSRIAVGKAGWNLAGTALWPNTNPYNDARTQARAFTAMLLAWQTNAPNAPTGGWAKALDDGLNNVLPQQAADGGWRYANTCNLSLNYMSAMLADALIRVHESYRPDPRIPVAVKKTADFLWTQWRNGDAIPSFNYYEATCVNMHGTGGQTATPDLTGLFVSTYAWLARQDPAGYRTKSDAVFAATMNGMYPQGSKQFNQAFAYGWRALGYLP